MHTRFHPVRAFWAIPLIASVLSLSGCRADEGSSLSRPLRILAWVGYDEAEFVKPIEKIIARPVEVKTYVGGDQMYSLFTSAPPGSYDLVVVDAEFGARMFSEDLLFPLEEEVWKSDDLFRTFSDGSPARVKDAVFGAVLRWGAIGLVFDTTKVSETDATSYEILFSPSVKGRVGIFDWYLPNMGVLSLSAGNSEPYDLTATQLEQVGKRMRELRSQVAAIHPNTGDVIGDLRSGRAWVSPGIGEWAAAVLAEEGRPIDWAVPQEGGIMWVEALAIPKSAKDPHVSRSAIAAFRTPESLARLAWRRAYHSQVTRRSAYEHLTEKQRRLLKAVDLASLETLMIRLRVRRLPNSATTESDWIREWTRFKAH